MTIVSCSVPLTELFPYLSFDFLHYICKETKFFLIHLEYMNQESIWGEITNHTVQCTQVAGMSFFSENRIEVRGIRKEQEAPGKVRKWKVVETVGADRGFFDGSLSTASNLPVVEPGGTD